MRSVFYRDKKGVCSREKGFTLVIKKVYARDDKPHKQVGTDEK